MLSVVKAKVKDNYKVYLEFNDGLSGIIDFKSDLERDHRTIIRELLDRKTFETAKVDLHTLCWNNGVDFAPEYLYEKINCHRNAA